MSLNNPPIRYVVIENGNGYTYHKRDEATMHAWFSSSETQIIDLETMTFSTKPTREGVKHYPLTEIELHKLPIVG